MIKGRTDQVLVLDSRGRKVVKTWSVAYKLIGDRRAVIE